MMDTRDWAREYISNNWLPIPLKGKIPANPDGRPMLNWTDFRPSDIENEFSGQATNIGIRTDTLTDVDLDCPEAIALAPAILPKTATFGRSSAPQSHWVYTTSTSQYVSYDSLFGKVLELRANNGHQTMVPPSIHPTGEPVSWTKGHEPSKIDGDTLKRSCSLLASAAVVCHNWLPGQRDILTTSFSRILHEHVGLDEADIENLIEAIAKSAGDDDWRDRVKKVSKLLAGLEQGRRKLGIPTFIKTIGKLDASRVLDWLEVDAAEDVEPADIFSVGAAPELPVDCLPQVLRTRAFDVSERVSCNPELAVFPGMCAINFAAGARVRVQLLQNDEEFLQPPIFYSFVALPSGTGKSPPRKAMFEPIQDIQNAEEKIYKEELEIWQELPKKGRGPAPTRKVSITTNVTSEGLIRALARNPQGVLVTPDELAGLLNGANQYKGGRGNDVETLMELYDGSAISSTRKSDEASDYLSATQVNVYGTIQPKVLPTLIREENVNSGLVARFGLAAYPKEINRVPVDRQPDVEARDNWQKLLRSLRQAFEGDIEDKVVFRFESDAQPLIAEWRKKHLAELKKTPEPFRAHLAKYQGLLARIALCFHLAKMFPLEPESKHSHYDGTEVLQWNIPADPISKETLREAMRFLDTYLKPHAQRLYAVVDNAPGRAMGCRIASEILLADPRLSTITVSEIMRRSRTGMKVDRQIADGFRYLDSMGWGSFDEHDQSQSKKPAKRFTVNPRIHDSAWNTSE